MSFTQWNDTEFVKYSTRVSAKCKICTETTYLSESEQKLSITITSLLEVPCA